MSTDNSFSSRDITRAPMLDARASTRCPVRTHLTFDPPPNVVDVPLDEAVRARMDAGRTFEDEVMDALVEVHGPIPSFDGDPEGAMKAMAEGAPILAQVPLVDEVGRRTGRPDLLVATDGRTPVGTVIYLPVEIKHHLVAATAKTEGEGRLRAIPFTELLGRGSPDKDLRAVDPAPNLDPRRRGDDLLILAHYHRLLDAAGHAGLPTGVIIGSEGLAAVFHLDAVTFNSWRNFTGRWTTMEAYDREFGFRLDIAVVASDRAAGTTTEDPVVVPARNSECPSCPWEQVCAPRMESADELTLLPGISWRQRQELREQGVHTRQDLAALDPADQPTKSLAAAVDHARLASAGVAVARRRGVRGLVLPRADVEVDVDMESADNEVYLWGNLVTKRSQSAGPADPIYVPFADFSASPDPDRMFAEFWRWLTDLRDTTVADGRTFAAYCWSGAENRYLRYYGARHDISVEAFIASAQWVDLEKVVKAHVITPDGRTSLKSIAPLADFAWRDTDPGGAQSMVWYAQARSGDDAARQRLLDYNTDDVRATLAVRDWLETAWADLPSVDVAAPA